MEGRVQKIAKERALLEAAFVRDTNKTVQQHIQEVVAQLGENIQVPTQPFSHVSLFRLVLTRLHHSLHCLHKLNPHACTATKASGIQGLPT